MRKLKLSLVFIFCSYFSFSQNVTGTIIDQKTGEPLTGVNIYLRTTKEGTTTNSKGQFNFKTKISSGLNDTLHISFVGYITQKITINELEQRNHKIYLSEDIQKLKEVTITTSKILKPKLKYTRLASLKKGVHSFGSLVIDNKIYVIGGDLSVEKDLAKETLFESGYGGSTSLIESLERKSSEFNWHEYSENLWKYDLESNIWERSNLEFRKRAYHNIHLYNNKIYVLGGKRLSKNQVYEYLDDKIEVYDIMSDTILIDHTNPHQAVNFASCIYNDNIIVLGGSTKMNSNGEKEYSNQTHLYDLKTGNWYELNQMPNPKETKGILVNDKIYLFGGFYIKPLKEIESFDLTTGEWKKEGNLFHETKRPGLTYHNNFIYIFDNKRLYTYNLETRELNEYFISLDLIYPEIHYANNKLYILGGYYEDEVSIIPSPDLFCVDISEFEKTKVRNSIIL
ncbi:MAG: carboxypeptidase-like regulatory domain-containing protein [Bacteroidetes bacterium]|nr:carboxypeptidase-like regulatory domain-containing protein [Bacteroidota bacterium]